MERSGDVRPRLDPLTIAAVTVAIIAVSSSGALIAYAAAPALAIAFWRNAMAVGVLAPVAVMRRRDELRGLRAKGALRWCLLAGIALAAHFGTWVPAPKLTTVATATALVATQPVWAGLIAVGQGRRLGRWTWFGIATAVVGAAVTAGVDFTSGGHTALLGDVLAVLGGMMAAVYTSLGEKARAQTSTTTYTTVCYSVCAVLLLAVCLAFGVQLSGYPGSTWVALLALTAGAQLLGHSLLNYALHKISATTISVLVLLEVPGAALLGWAWLGQTPRPAAWPGITLLVAGVAVVVLGARRTPTPPTPDPLDLDTDQPTPEARPTPAIGRRPHR
ncbi:DMT family transporter [Catellatospora tritici]|uniref:DMT family transporter n=1 Tax=Catellatospora tritici TaxID=2851566 RepID=UPI003555E853